MFLLSGILSKLVKVSQDSCLSQSSVKSEAVSTWTLFVSTLLTDGNVANAEHGKTEGDVGKHLGNPAWLDKAQQEVDSQIKIMSSLSSNSNVKLRESLLNLVTTLSRTSWNTLSRSSSTLLDILVTLSVDEMKHISKKAEKELD